MYSEPRITALRTCRFWNLVSRDSCSSTLHHPGLVKFATRTHAQVLGFQPIYTVALTLLWQRISSGRPSGLVGLVHYERLPEPRCRDPGRNRTDIPVLPSFRCCNTRPVAVPELRPAVAARVSLTSNISGVATLQCHPPGVQDHFWSRRRGSNPRPERWQRPTLPTVLLLHIRTFRHPSIGPNLRRELGKVNHSQLLARLLTLIKRSAISMAADGGGLTLT